MYFLYFEYHCVPYRFMIQSRKFYYIFMWNTRKPYHFLAWYICKPRSEYMICFLLVFERNIFCYPSLSIKKIKYRRWKWLLKLFNVSLKIVYYYVKNYFLYICIDTLLCNVSTRYIVVVIFPSKRFYDSLTFER